jgi:hypothetical protein
MDDPERIGAAVDEEIGFHIEMRAAELEAAGSSAEARVRRRSWNSATSRRRGAG